MSVYYSPGMKRGLYRPETAGPFRLSRSKIDLFLNCPRCFYFDRRLGIGRPPGYPFSLNSAVDKLLKKEFDIHRQIPQSHPLMKTYHVDAVPFKHASLDQWRDPFRGIRFLHGETNFEIFGAIDDVWINPYKELHVVDYKSTAKEAEVNLDADWQIGYKRQMEIYQWLFHRNGFKVSPVGYFVYANGNADRKAFDGRLEFRVSIIPYSGNFDWLEEVLLGIKKCLDANALPEQNPECDYCLYREKAFEAENKK